MCQYTNEKQNDYQAMLKAISAHKDFGKRNPVDIGIECGYTKEDVLDMIQMIQSKKNSVQENESSTKEDKNDREEYYFLFHRGSEEDAYIVSLDINNWSTKIVKVIESFDGMRLTDPHVGHWQIKDNIFVWTQQIWDMDSGLDFIEKTVYWEDLKTGEQRKLLTDDDVANVLIRDSDTCIFTSGEVIIWGNDDKIEKRKIGCSSGYDDLIFEENEQIYRIGSRSIYKYDSNFNEEELERDEEYGYSIKAVEFENGKFSWYEAKENVHLFSSDWSYKKFTEKKSSYSRDSEGLFANELDVYAGILKGVFTKNYRLLQDEIRSIDNEKAICSFKRKVDKDSHCGQVIGIPEKDIFIGIGGDRYYNEYLIKIDLRNERQAVTIPVELPKK